MLDGYQVTVICYQTHKDYLYCQRRQILDDHNKLIMEHPNKKRMKYDFILFNFYVFIDYFMPKACLAVSFSGSNSKTFFQ